MFTDIEQRYESERIGHLMTAWELVEFTKRSRAWIVILLAVTVVEFIVIRCQEGVLR